MKKLSLILMVAFGLVSAAMAADVAFTSLSGNRVPLTYAWPIIDTGGLVTGAVATGVQFTPSVGGTLDTVLVAVKRHQQFSKSLAVPRVWTIEVDAGGRPSGIVLDRLAGVPPASISNLVLRSDARPYLKAGSQYWLLAIKTTDGNYDNWATSELIPSRPEFAKWPVVYQQTGGWLNNKAHIPAFCINVVKGAEPPPVVTPPVVTPPVVTPPVVTPPVVTPPVVEPPAPETVEMLKSELNEIIESLENVAEKLKKLNE